MPRIERRALRLIGPRLFGPLESHPLDSADLQPGHLIVRRTLGTICGTDVPNWNGSEWSTFPSAPGFPLHECVGTVMASRSIEHSVGRRVLAIPRAIA